MEEKLVYTVDEASEILGICKPTLYQAIDRGEIPALRIGRRILIPVAALERKLAEVGCKKES